MESRHQVKTFGAPEQSKTGKRPGVIRERLAQLRLGYLDPIAVAAIRADSEWKKFRVTGGARRRRQGRMPDSNPAQRNVHLLDSNIPSHPHHHCKICT